MDVAMDMICVTGAAVANQCWHIRVWWLMPRRVLPPPVARLPHGQLLAYQAPFFLPTTTNNNALLSDLQAILAAKLVARTLIHAGQDLGGSLSRVV